MPDRRPLVLINGSLYVLPIGDDLVMHRPLVLEAGELKQLDAAENPREHAVLVFIDEESGIHQWNGFDILIGVVNPTDFNVHDIQTNMIAGVPEGQIACSELQVLVIPGAHPTALTCSDMTCKAIFGIPTSHIAVTNLESNVISGVNEQLNLVPVIEGNIILES